MDPRRKDFLTGNIHPAPHDWNPAANWFNSYAPVNHLPAKFMNLRDDSSLVPLLFIPVVFSGSSLASMSLDITCFGVPSPLVFRVWLLRPSETNDPCTSVRAPWNGEGSSRINLPRLSILHDSGWQNSLNRINANLSSRKYTRLQGGIYARNIWMLLVHRTSVVSGPCSMLMLLLSWEPPSLLRSLY